jgi:multicomponent Na+:H+ antiporter subunit D
VFAAGAVRFDGAAAHLLPLAVTVPIVAACVLIAGRKMPRALTDTLAVSTALGVAGIDGAILANATANRIVSWTAGWRPRQGFSVGVVLVADPLNAGLALTVAALMAAALLYSWR